METYKPPAVPEGGKRSFSKYFSISPSDIDLNQHTNNTVYYRLLFDAATEASLKEGLFSLLSGDICGYNVLESKALYLRESGMWDKVKVTVWEDSDSPDTIHCIITKNNQQLFQASVKFYIPAKL